MDWYDLLLFAAIVVLLETIPIVVLLLLPTRKAVYLTGLIGTAVIFMLGLIASFVFDWLHRGLGGSSNTSPLLGGLLLTLFATAPLLFTTLLCARRLKHKPVGLCSACNYDLRGNPHATHCPECGEHVYRRQLSRPNVQ